MTSKYESDELFYESAVQLASQDEVLEAAIRLQLNPSRTDGQDEYVESYIHDEGYIDDIRERYGLFDDFAVEAYLRCVRRIRSENRGEA